MKVIHIASGDLWAGAEVQLYNLACSLKELPDLELEVILLNHGELESRLWRAGIRCQVLDEQRLGSLRIGWRLLRYLRQARPDIVHTHRQKENVLGGIAALLARVPSVRTVHGSAEGAPPWWRLDKRGYRWLDWFCGRYLQRQLVAVSGDLGEALTKRFPSAQVSVIENGIEQSAVLRAAGRLPPLPGRPGRLRIALVGRLVPVKRVDLFLRTARRLHEHRPEAIDFYIVGDGPEAGRCRVLIEVLGLRGNVHMLGFRPDATAVLAAMDLLLITSDHEGLPMVLLEAMSLGVPVVASAVGGIPAVLDHGRYGRLVNVQQPQRYAESVLSLLDDQRGRQALARQAQERVREHYTAARNAAAYHDLYGRLCAGTGTRTAERSRATAPTGKSSGA